MQVGILTLSGKVRFPSWRGSNDKVGIPTFAQDNSGIVKILSLHRRYIPNYNQIFSYTCRNSMYDTVVIRT